MKRMKVLVVDDDPSNLYFLCVKLEALDFEVFKAHDGPTALDQAQTVSPDLVVLDLTMPGMDGLEVLRELRTLSNVPVIVLSARGADGDRIKGLRLGADDYLAKPFNPDELVARIEAIGRRVRSAPAGDIAETLHIGEVVIDPGKRAVRVAGEAKHLTRIEWRLLNEMAANRGRLLLYEELLARVWGPEYRDDIQLLRTCVSRLRGKIQPDSAQQEIIRTIPRTGYIMEQDTSDDRKSSS